MFILVYVGIGTLVIYAAIYAVREIKPRFPKFWRRWVVDDEENLWPDG